MSLQVKVLPQFRPDASRTGIYVFSYQVQLFNPTDRAIQVLRRHWIIREAHGAVTEVEGEGVVGLQPVLPPLTPFEYSSWVEVKSLPSTMHGEYTCQDAQGGLLKVPIPAFMLRLPDTILN